MANFATKAIDSFTRKRLQRLADSLPHIKGTVIQKSGVMDGSRYFFNGEVRRTLYNGLLLGTSYTRARDALRGLAK